MKKFIYSLLLIFNLAANAQEVISIFDLPVITEADSNDIFIIARPSDTVTYKLSYENFTATLDSAIIANGDSITVHWSYIVALLDSISDLRDAIGTGGGNDTTVVDETPPQLISSIIRSAFPGITELYFDENIEYVSEDSVIYNFSYVTSTNNGSSITIDSCNYNLDTLFFFHDSLSATDIPYLVYFNAKDSGLQDESGNPVTFMSATVNNNILAEEDTSLIHRWRFENDLTDSKGDSNGTYADMVYSSNRKEGSKSFDHTYFEGMTGIDVGEFTYPDSGTIAMWIYPSGKVSPYYNMWMGNSEDYNSDNGFVLQTSTYSAVSDDRKVLFYTRGGGVREQANSAGNAITSNSWNHIAVNYWKSDGKAVIYVNGEINTEDSTTRNDYTITGKTTVLGNNAGYGFAAFGYMDDVRIYNRPLSADDISYIYLNPNDSIIVPPPPPPPDSLDIDVKWSIDFDDIPAADTGQQYWDENSPQLSQYFPSPDDGIQGFPDEQRYIYYDNPENPGNMATTGRVYVRDYSGNKVLRMEVDSGYHAGPFITSYVQGNNTELIQSINYRYKPGLNYKYGGKISGIRSYKEVKDYNVPTDGFSNMISFRDDSMYTSGAWVEGLAHYLNWPGKSEYGYSAIRGFNDTTQVSGGYWKPPNDGSWFNVTQRVVLNTLNPIQDNGFIEIWVNGVFSNRWDGLRLRTTADCYVDQNILWFYWGGNSTANAPIDNPAYIEYDDIYYYNWNNDSGMPVDRDKADGSGMHKYISVPGWPKD